MEATKENILENEEFQEKKRVRKKKRDNTNIFFIVILVLAFVVLVLRPRPDSVTQVENAEKVTHSLKDFRISLEQYYEKYGNYPENLIGDIKFLEIYGKKTIDSTKEFEGYPESNQVYILENFADVTENGGWNYNPKTGEIRANLKFNSYHQQIDWSMI